jgi:rRNA maturation endonuclease Nob1
MSKTMNYCSNCNQALKRDDKFCAACGEQVAIMSATENVKPTKGKRVLLDDLVALRQLIEGAA